MGQHSNQLRHTGQGYGYLFVDLQLNPTASREHTLHNFTHLQFVEIHFIARYRFYFGKYLYMFEKKVYSVAFAFSVLYVNYVNFISCLFISFISLQIFLSECTVMYLLYTYRCI